MPENKSGAQSSSLAGRRVLIIEDKSMVTMLLQDMLADIGCEVAGFAFRYPDALTKSTSLLFDAAILDVNLNGQHTFPIAEAIGERGLAYVFSTGYGEASIPEPLQSAPVLQKPFRQADLERALRTALGIAD